MHAHDIPRYDAQGYVAGRPDTANDPTSAGRVQGAPAGGFTPPGDGQNGHAQTPGAHPEPPFTGYGETNSAGDPAMHQSAPMGQPGMPPPPYGMPYGGVDPAYGMPHPGVHPMGQPGMPPPPYGMPYPGTDPAYGMPGYQQPAAAAQGFQAEQYGRIADVVRDISNGEQPDANKLVELFHTFDTPFWKGALIGAVVTLLATNETAKAAIAGTLGGIFGAFTKEGGEKTGASAETDKS
jgi:hypothetical protein